MPPQDIWYLRLSQLFCSPEDIQTKMTGQHAENDEEESISKNDEITELLK